MQYDQLGNVGMFAGFVTSENTSYCDILYLTARFPFIGLAIKWQFRITKNENENFPCTQYTLLASCHNM